MLLLLLLLLLGGGLAHHNWVWLWYDVVWCVGGQANPDSVDVDGATPLFYAAAGWLVVGWVDAMG